MEIDSALVERRHPENARVRELVDTVAASVSRLESSMSDRSVESDDAQR